MNQEQMEMLTKIISDSADKFLSAKVQNGGSTSQGENDISHSGDNILRPDFSARSSENLSGVSENPSGMNGDISGGADSFGGVSENPSGMNGGISGGTDSYGGVSENQSRMNRDTTDGYESVSSVSEKRIGRNVRRRGNIIELDWGINQSVNEEAIKECCDDIRKHDSLLKDCANKVIRNILPYSMKGMAEKQAKAYQNSNTERHVSNKTIYKKDSVTVNGKDMTFNRVMQLPDWSIELNECLSNDDRARNYDAIRTKITQCLYDYYGGFTRFNTVVVSGYQLIINGVCYMPKLTGAILDKFPFDSVDYIKNGCLAPFLDWGYLQKMTKLQTLSIDDPDFVMTYIAEDLGVGRDFIPTQLFGVCKGLRVLEIGSDVLTCPLEGEQATEDTKKAVSRVERQAHEFKTFNKGYGVFKDKVCGVFGGVRKWSVGNLVNYANNRGDKGIFMYSGGILARAVVSGLAGVSELGVRSVGGLVKGAVTLVGKAVGSSAESAKRPVESDNGGIDSL